MSSAMESMATTAVTSAVAAASASASAYPAPNSLMPPSSNPALNGPLGDGALYNRTLILMSFALFQHTLVFGILALLRNFNFPRLLDLHFLTTVFAATFVAAPLIFLINSHIDAIKLFFFLEHVAVEFLIAIRVLFTPLCRNHSGKILLGCWFGISALSIVVACNWEPGFYHGADIVAWTAFVSDGSVAVAGAVLIYRWIKKRSVRRSQQSAGHKFSPKDQFRRKIAQAEAMAGIGFILHGVTTMAVGPVFFRVLYKDASTNSFAYAWVAVFATALFAVGLSSPSIGILLGTVNWCCAHNRKVLPGQANYDDTIDEEIVPVNITNGRVDRAHTNNHWNKWSDTTDESYKVSAVGPNGSSARA